MPRPKRKYSWSICCYGYWYFPDIDSWFKSDVDENNKMFERHMISSHCDRRKKRAAMKQVNKLLAIGGEDIMIYKQLSSKTRAYNGTRPKLWVIKNGSEARVKLI
jgi:hypothetical protein